MKRLFLVLFILPFLFSCSSDDEKYDIDKASIILKFSDLHPPQADVVSGIYYEPNNITILYYLADSKNGTPTFVTDGTCPACKTKGKIQYKYDLDLSNESNPKIKSINIHCSKCKAEFDAYSGKGEDFQIGTYKAKTDFSKEDFEVYIWK